MQRCIDRHHDKHSYPANPLTDDRKHTGDTMTLSRRTALLTAAAAVAAPAISVPAARAAAPKLGKQVPGFFRFNVGDFEITSLNDGQNNYEVTAQRFPNAPVDDVIKLMESQFTPARPGISPFNTMVVNTGSKLVLIDSGFSNNGSPTTGMMTANMAAAGILPGQIDTVLISHFHQDHINGLRSKEGALVYPNAEIVVPMRDVAHYLDDAKMSAASEVARGSFLTARRVLSPILKDVKQAEWGKEWANGITAIQSDGHTPGHTSFVISSGTKTLLVVGDAINDPRIFARQPDWHFGGDLDRQVAVATRRKILDMAAADKMQSTFYHAAFPATGFIARNGAAYDWFPASFSSVI
jgi:glyoxylase-like metal-dependent hydrolase (beta-lactamase superfamily II)